MLGKTKQDYASILKWMSLANSEVLPSLSSWFGPLIGRDSYNKKNVEESAKATNKAVGVLEGHLLLNTYLVGERLTLADIFSVGVFTRGFQYVSVLGSRHLRDARLWGDSPSSMSKSTF